MTVAVFFIELRVLGKRYSRYRRFGSWPSDLAWLPGIIAIISLFVIGFAITCLAWLLP